MDLIPFENREKLDLKVTPEGHAQLMRVGKEMAPEDVVIRLREDISRLENEIKITWFRARQAANEHVYFHERNLPRNISDRILHAAKGPAEWVEVGELIEKSREKYPEDVERLGKGYLILKPFYLKWKKIAAEKKALEKEYEERAAQL